MDRLNRVGFALWALAGILAIFASGISFILLLGSVLTLIAERMTTPGNALVVAFLALWGMWTLTIRGVIAYMLWRDDPKKPIWTTAMRVVEPWMSAFAFALVTVILSSALLERPFTKGLLNIGLSDTLWVVGELGLTTIVYRLLIWWASPR